MYKIVYLQNEKTTDLFNEQELLRTKQETYCIEKSYSSPLQEEKALVTGSGYSDKFNS